jgi:predicted transcriptional regulator of viral defense system
MTEQVLSSNKPKKRTKLQSAISLAKTRGVLTPADLESRGIPRQYLMRLETMGLLEKDSRGLYTCIESDYTHYHNYVQVCKKIPSGVICLSSALRFHDLTTIEPRGMWVALEPGKYHPKLDYPQVRFFTMSGECFTRGVEEHDCEGVTVKVFNAAKTVADCFRFRNRIGIDIAVEALKDYWRSSKGTLEELRYYAEICKVRNIMKPYIQMLTIA